MRRMTVVLWMLTFALFPLKGQEDGVMEHVMMLLGCEAEDADDEEVERLCGLLKRPVGMNIASDEELIESGLFSRYQVASLKDYRQRRGDVMSFMELAALDGFGEDFVMRIRPFVSLDNCSLAKWSGLSNEIIMRSSIKRNGDGFKYSYDAKYKVATGNFIRASVGLSRSLDASVMRPDILSGHLECRSRKIPAKFILGDFNARFGQGLNVWNGMNISSLYSPPVFMRRPSGLTATGSMTGKYAFTGLASEFRYGRFVLSTMLAAPGVKQMSMEPDKVKLMPAANLTYEWRYGQCGLTHSAEFTGFMTGIRIPSMKTSADVAMCLRGVDMFAELAHEWVGHESALRSGLVFPIGETMHGAAMLRLSRDEFALAASGSLLTGKWMRNKGDDASRRRLDATFSADMIFYPEPKSDTQKHSAQIKLHTQWNYALSESFGFTLRLTELLRSWGLRFRTDVRSDFHWNSEDFSASVRLNILNCRGTSFLTYVEGGYKSGKLGLHLRQGLFVVDNWDDRIYAYERDAPGSFNVPSYYGRGVWTSMISSWRFSGWGRLYVRCGWVCYPFMKEKKPGRAELKLYYALDF